MIDLALLGCGGSMPTPNRYLSSTLIQYLGRKILVDCGEGCQVSMKLLGWGFKTIDIICITHFHGDHIFGLPGLLSTIGNSGRTDPIRIIGPTGLSEIISGLKTFLPYLPYDLILYENPSLFINEEFEIKTLQLDHSSPCLGYSFYLKRRPRFSIEKAHKNNVPKTLWNKLQKGEIIHLEGKEYTPDLVLGEERNGIKISIITDTRPIDTIPSFIKDSNCFICEGTYAIEDDLPKALQNKHMIFKEAAQLAKQGNVDELILTHFSPVIDDPNLYIDQVKTVFYKTTIGYDRLIKTFQFNKKSNELIASNVEN